jgi:hypothetical protein
MGLAFRISSSTSTPDRLQLPVDWRAVRDCLYHLRDLRTAIVCSFPAQLRRRCFSGLHHDSGERGAQRINGAMKIDIAARSAGLSAGIDNGADDAVNYLLAIA